MSLTKIGREELGQGGNSTCNAHKRKFHMSCWQQTRQIESSSDAGLARKFVGKAVRKGIKGVGFCKAIHSRAFLQVTFAVHSYVVERHSVDSLIRDDKEARKFYIRIFHITRLVSPHVKMIMLHI